MLDVILSFFSARLAEPTTKAAIGVSLTSFVGALAAGVDPLTAGLALITGAVVAVVPEAKPVLTDIQALAESTPVTTAPTATTPKSGLLLALIGAVGLMISACTPAEQAKLVSDIQVACQVDAQVQPVLITLGPALVPELAPVAATDAALVHPAVVAACAALHGTPTAVTAVTVAPAAAVK